MTVQEQEILLNKIEEWHKAGNHQYIVEAITHFPQEEWTADFRFLLARAYTLLGSPTQQEYFCQALRVLEALRHEYQDNAKWNYQVALALYYLFRPAEARQFVKHAIEVSDEPSEESLELLDLCEEALQFPRFPVSFPNLVKASWDNFAKNEAELRKKLDEKKSQEEILAFAENSLRPIIQDAYFQVGKSGDRYNLIFATDSSRASIFEYMYFVKQAPASLKANWDITCGAKQANDIDSHMLKVEGVEVKLADLRYNVIRTPEDEIVIQVFHPEMANKLDLQIQMQVVSILTKQLFGEARFLRFVPFIEIAKEDFQESMTPTELIDYMRLAAGDAKWDETEDFSYLLSENFDLTREPNGHELEEWYPRKDIAALHTVMPEIVQSYEIYDDKIMNYYHRHGIVPGFLIIASDDENLGEFEKSFNELVKDIPTELCTRIGYGVGHYYYVDMIAWDMVETLQLIEIALKENDHFKLVSFSTFRRGNNCIKIKADLTAFTQVKI